MNEEHVSLRVGGRDLEVVSLVADEEISALFRVDVVCRTDHATAPEDLRGSPASVTLRDGAGHERSIGGMVASARLRRHAAEEATLELVLRPSAFARTLGRDCYVLHDVDVIDVVKDILSDYQGPVAYRVARRYRKRDYCAQYREDDWTLLCRLLEEEGIHYFMDAGTLTFADDSRVAEDLEGGACIRYHASTGMQSGEEHIDAFGAVARIAPGRFTIGSFDPQKPRLKVQGSAGSSGREIYDAPGGGPVRPEDCARRAETMAEAAACAARSVRGATTSVRLVPGRIVEVGDHPIASLDGRYFVTSVHTEVAQRRRGDVEGPSTIHSSFRAIPADLPFRPEARTAAAKQAGLQTGVVVGTPGTEVHPDPTGRIRVQLHWDRRGTKDHTSGHWMRVAQRGSAASMLLPRVGWNVATFNEEGTVDAPRIISRLCDAEHPPPYDLPANKTRTTFKTATTPGGGSFNEIHFEDKLGAEEMFIHASRDMTTVVKNGKTEDIVRDAFRTVGVDRDLTVGTTFTESVGRNQKIAIGGNETVTRSQCMCTADTGHNLIEFRDTAGEEAVHYVAERDQRVKVVHDKTTTVANGEVASIERDETWTVGNKLDVKTGHDLSRQVGGNQTIAIAGRRKVTSDLEDNASVTGNRTVTISGQHFRKIADADAVSAENIVERVGGIILEASIGSNAARADGNAMVTVGGAVIELAGGNKTTTTELGRIETVGGLVLTKAKGEITLGAGKRRRTTVGGTLQITSGKLLSLSAKKSVKVSSPIQTLKGTKEITLKVGETEVVIKDGQVRIKTTEEISIDVSGTGTLHADDSIQI